VIIYPAIDLKEKKCVRLYQGDMNKVTVFNDSPVSQAQYFADSGFKNLHVVDLDGAVSGNSINSSTVQDILNNVEIEVQLGGGIRDIKAIEYWLNLGLKKVIIGTAALKNPELVKQAAKNFPGQIIVGIDAKNDFVAVNGWVEESKIKVIDLAMKFEDAGVDSIIYTDISKDGTLEGVSLKSTVKLANSISIPVIASGGVSNIDDIIRVSEAEKEGVKGVIVGRALYEKKITIGELQKFL
jgi:phosphoribosylformimino-5-aminoimidazole carboxamide ribotide isomerase